MSLQDELRVLLERWGYDSDTMPAVLWALYVIHCLENQRNVIRVHDELLLGAKLLTDEETKIARSTE